MIDHVDPATLLVDRNVRQDARLDREFLASIRDLGVLVPIVAVRVAEGSLRVRYGHRRTLAAIEAGHANVAVVVVADEATDDAAEVDRLVGAYAENEHRTALSTAERVDVFTQLSAFGVSAAQIGKRTKTKRGDVDAALAVAGSEVAHAVAGRYDYLTLAHAAAIAENESNPESVKALVKAARDGGFEHLAQRLRDERAEAAGIAKVANALTEAGVRVIDRPAWSGRAIDLIRLVSGTGEEISAKDHATCPGHAAYVKAQWVADNDDDDEDGEDGDDDNEAEYGDRESHVEYVTLYVCTDPPANGHRSCWDRPVAPRPAQTDEQREAANAERRRVVANNAAWRSAAAVRKDWLARFLTRKTAPKGAAAFVAGSLARADHDLRKALESPHLLSHRLLGGSSRTLAGTVATATDSRAQVVSLGLVLAAYEQGTGIHSWRSVSEATARYLGFLGACGYELADVERLACGDEPPPGD
jgi:ParB family chromosome partitioning protein